MTRIVESTHYNEDEYDMIKDDSLFTLKKLVEDSLAFSSGRDENYSEILKNLYDFGVKNAYLYLYDEPIEHKNKERFTIPDHVRIKAAMTDGDIKVIPYYDQIVSVDKMFDNEFITDNKYNMVLMPLYFRETLYGSILYDLTDITYKSGDFLANQYALVVRIIDRVH